MTYQQSLYSMTMGQLVIEAQKYGVKINKKGSKTKAADKIWEAFQQTESAPEVEIESAPEVEPAVEPAVEPEVETESAPAVEPEVEPEVEVEKKTSTKEFKFADSSQVENAVATLSQYGYTVTKKPIPGMALVVKMGKKTIIEFYLLKIGKYTALMNPSISEAFKNAELLENIEYKVHEKWSKPFEYFFTEAELLELVSNM